MDYGLKGDAKPTLGVLTGHGWSQYSPCHPGEQRQKPSAGLHAAPFVHEHVWLQFRPQLPLEHGMEQSTPCHPKETKERKSIWGVLVAPRKAACKLQPLILGQTSC